MRQKDYKFIAQVIRRVTQQALEHYEGYDLLVCNDIIQLLKEELSTEFMNDNKFNWETFYQNCDPE